MKRREEEKSSVKGERMGQAGRRSRMEQKESKEWIG